MSFITDPSRILCITIISRTEIFGDRKLNLFVFYFRFQKKMIKMVRIEFEIVILCFGLMGIFCLKVVRYGKNERIPNLIKISGSFV